MLLCVCVCLHLFVVWCGVCFAVALVLGSCVICLLFVLVWFVISMVFMLIVIVGETGLFGRLLVVLLLFVICSLVTCWCRLVFAFGCFGCRCCCGCFVVLCFCVFILLFVYLFFPLVLFDLVGMHVCLVMLSFRLLVGLWLLNLVVGVDYLQFGCFMFG